MTNRNRQTIKKLKIKSIVITTLLITNTTMNENLNLVESLKDCQEGTKIFMTKQEYLNSLPFRRKAELYIQYLEYS